MTAGPSAHQALGVALVVVAIAGCRTPAPSVPERCRAVPSERIEPPDDLQALGFGSNVQTVRYGDLDDPHRQRALVIAAPDLIRFALCYHPMVFSQGPEPIPAEPWLQSTPDGSGTMAWGASYCEQDARVHAPSEPLGPPEIRQFRGELALLDLDRQTGQVRTPAARIPVDPVFSQYFKKENHHALSHTIGRSIYVGDLLPCRLDAGRPVGCGDEIVASASSLHAFYVFEPDPEGPAPYRQVAGYPVVDEPVDHPFESWIWPRSGDLDGMLRGWAASGGAGPAEPADRGDTFVLLRDSVGQEGVMNNHRWAMSAVDLNGAQRAPRILSEAYFECAREAPDCPWRDSSRTLNAGKTTTGFTADDFNGDSAPDLVFFHHGPHGLTLDLWPGDPDSPATVPGGPPIHRRSVPVLRDGDHEIAGATRVLHVTSGRFWAPDRAALLVSLQGHGRFRDDIAEPQYARAIVCQVLFTTSGWELERVSCWPDPTGDLHGTTSYGSRLLVADVLAEADSRPEVIISAANSPLVPGRVDVYRTSAEDGVLWEQPVVTITSPHDDREAFGYATMASYVGDDAPLQTLFVGAPSSADGLGALYRVDLPSEGCP